MTEVFTTAAGGGQYVIGKKRQVFPVTRLRDDEPISQRLIVAAQADDLRLASELVSHPYVNVNFIGTLSLKFRKTEVVLNGESASEVRVEFKEFRTDVTALFLAAHNGNLALVRKLLALKCKLLWSVNDGANVNQKLFRGYATTAAVREGHLEVLETLLNGGAAQAACEEALLEACSVGRARAAELLMASDMIRPHIAVHALVVASSRGFVDSVAALIKSGVDANANTRMLLQSSKPSLHANVGCNALVAAVVSRQTSVVQLLLNMGCRRDAKVRLGAWLWDLATGEEFRVGAGLAEPYHISWCAVEYFEASGAILRMLIQHSSPNLPHLGRTILHHAILCGNARALEVLLSNGTVDTESSIQTSQVADTRGIHLAARLGLAIILRLLINAGCDVNSRTGCGETALMICARHKQEECLKILASAGSDFGLCSDSGQSAMSIAGLARWHLVFQQAVLEVIRTGTIARSSNPEVFSSLLFVARANDADAMMKLIQHQDLDIDETYDAGFSAVMVAAAGGHVEIFRLLVNAGADVELQNNYGETAVTLAKASQKRDAFAEILISTKGDMSKSDLHRAARFGNQDLVQELVSKGFDVNLLDCDGYTPLMFAAKSGDGTMCELLISLGAKCGLKNARHETALSLARGDEAERVILDELARELVTRGARVKKHTKAGKGTPHAKTLRMVEARGVLSWGKSSRRNVICRGAEVGMSSTFRWNRRWKSDGDDQGLFRLVTTKNKEFHFSCCGGSEVAELWVRGIRLVTREAIFGRSQ
ncbi:hypothetical protein SASPL_142588 [Salvia splendens]|uniref:Ankyrin-3 n=1 Tax=Salvia splendens TaxID=180675 RepID=A0A8X8WLR8_SALSN|nr:hypothetical protein SASPL_142588 [Salvia splendens]